jgi:hypothetical protein
MLLLTQYRRNPDHSWDLDLTDKATGSVQHTITAAQADTANDALIMLALTWAADNHHQLTTDPS